MFDQDNSFSQELEQDRQNLVNLVMGTYRSLRNDIAYVSMPITSGKNMYEVLLKKGVKTLEELKKVDPKCIFKEIVKPNIERGLIAADNLNSKLPVLAPSVFEGKSLRWTEKEYMTLWLEVIKERAREIHMSDDWEYSNGGVEEFALAQKMRYRCIPDIEEDDLIEDMAKIRTYDLNGEKITISSGIDKINEALKFLKYHGFESERLSESLRDLMGTRETFEGWGAFREDYRYHVYGIN